jgi:hypothetical protein
LEARLKKRLNFEGLIVFNPNGKMDTFASKKSRAMHVMSFSSEHMKKTNGLATLTNWETLLEHIENF